MDLSKLLTLGKELGLEGQSLLEFVDRKENEAIEREVKKEREMRERAEQKEREKLEREDKLNREKVEREERARARESNIRQLELENENKIRVLEFEKNAKLEIMDREIELEKVKTGHAEVKKKGCMFEGTKLPPFEEGQDDIDSYLRRFERFATVIGWPQEEWALRLSSLLKGKSLDTYCRLSQVDCDNYERVKEALLRRFELTQEGFRQKFRTCKPEVGESAPQFAHRLESYLMRWVELTNTDKTFNAIKDLLLREQFLNVASRSLAVFLKERKPKSVSQMADIAEQYLEAHGLTFMSQDTGNSQGKKPGNSERQEVKERSGSTQDKGNVSKVCYFCRKPGHQINDCFERQKILKSHGGKKAAGLVSMEGEVEDELREEALTAGDKDIDVEASACCVGKGFEKNCCISDNKVRLECGHELPLVSALSKSHENRTMPVLEGFLNNRKITVLRDTGCSSVVVRKKLINAEQFIGKNQRCVLIDGTVREVPVAKVMIDTPFFSGEVEALCMVDPIYDLILGNIPGVRSPNEPDELWSQCKQYIGDTVDAAQAVQTRSQKRKENCFHKLKVMKGLEINKTEFVNEQKQDTTLNWVRRKAETGEQKTKGDTVSWFEMRNGLLYRYFRNIDPSIEESNVRKQLVVPQNYRGTVMKLAHDSILGGHLGIKKTGEKIRLQFVWPGLAQDVKLHCLSCDLCQRTVPKGKVGKVPLQKMPLIETPFQRVAIDLVGPIHPVTENKNRYILTLMDYATRYPEAVPLPSIEAERVAEALFGMFTRLGFPAEILTDLGSQFTSEVMKEVSRLFSIQMLHTTPYHPMCNGLVERFNGTLKSMLRKVCSEKPRDWDRYVQALLFAYREAPQSSLGFSPFELLYGRTVKGPMAILKDLWTDELAKPEVKTTYQYVLDLRQRLEDTLEVARTELEKSSAMYKRYYDKNSKARSFQVNDDVLILLPTDGNKLLMQWKGPFKVVGKTGVCDYRISVNGKIKTFHANLLKKYFRRQDESCTVDGRKAGKESVLQGVIEITCASVIDDNSDKEITKDDTGDEKGALDDEVLLELPDFQGKETVEDVKVYPMLSEAQEREVRQLLNEFRDVLTDLPGETNLVEHEIRLTSDNPVRTKQYPLPFAMTNVIRDETKKMLDMGIVEASQSPYSSPVVLVKKSDQSVRFCIDFRNLNKLTVFDAEPIPNPEEIFAKLSTCKYFSKIDLSKGYWQIRMEESSKEKTAFSTPDGLFQFRKMPFGLVTAPANFSRMMRKLLKDLKDFDNFIDDILEHTDDWASHMIGLREVFLRLRQSGLTARPSKCMIGFSSIEFLGHLVGDGIMTLNTEKVKDIEQAERPYTKKGVMSFLGMVGFYRKFVPNFAEIALPLTNLTKKGNPSRVMWTDEHQRAFNTLKKYMVSYPILRLPNLNRLFILRTDASNVGIGAVLLQESDGIKFPVAYASKKLLPRETRYSVIERECLALVWGIGKFQMYLYGREFQVETDHCPLIYMQNTKLNNSRIMRWVLSLQQYRFRVVAIRGSENVEADYLSRS